MFYFLSYTVLIFFATTTYRVIEGDTVLFEEWYSHIMSPRCRVTWTSK